MGAIPSDIPGIGSTSLQPRPNPGFDPMKHGLTSDDYFVFSRMDGQTSLRDVILETGFAPERAIGIIGRLRQMGAFLLPGEAEPPRPGQQPSARGTVRIKPIARPEPPPEPPPEPAKKPTSGPLFLTAEEELAMAEDVVLDDGDKREVFRLMRLIDKGDYFGLFGVAESVDRKTLKRAYFTLSKRFHPDRYYRKNTGSFGPLLSRIFETASRAFETLSDDRRRAEYLRAQRGELAPAPAPRAQTREEHAAELFARGCQLEARGKHEEALQMLGAVVRQHPLPRYLARAARCALAASQLNLAEEYAKKAAELEADDPSYARLLASVYRAAGKLRLAEQLLEHALSLNTDNDMLVGELRADLADVRSKI